MKTFSMNIYFKGKISYIFLKIYQIDIKDILRTFEPKFYEKKRV